MSDTAYMDAVSRGDMKAAQRMVDAAAEAAGYSETRYYHGSTSGQKPGNVLNRREVFFLTKRQDVAEKYSSNNQVISVLIPRNQKVLSASGPNDLLSILPKELSRHHKDNEYSWEVLQDPDLPGLYEDSDVIGFLRDELGYDGIKVKDDVAGGEQHESLAWFRTENIKSSDPVTYDDDGNVIPLSRRFDSESPDIRNPRTRSLKQFPYEYAAYLKKNFPDIWRAGGNIRGNDTFRWWTAYRKGDRSKKVLYWWETMRPAWIARHFNDHRLPGVIAQIKWGAVGKLGVAGMKRVVEDAIRKRYA
jgi:hypothetical protein